MPLNVETVRANGTAALRSAWKAFVTVETAAVLVLVVGWSLLTWGIASLTVWQAWPISAGLFLLGCFGFRLLWRVFGDGLYALSAASREDRR